MRRTRLVLALFAAVLAGLTAPHAARAAFGEGELRLRVIDATTQQPVAARMHLRTVHGKAVRPPRTAYWHDHFAIDGQITLKLKRGQYLFELDCGPEFKPYQGHFDIQDHADDEKTFEMHRFVNLSKEGWWSGDLNVQRPLDQMQLAMRADDLHLAGVVSWRRDRTKWLPPKSPLQGIVTFDGNRVYSDLVGEDARQGGGLLFFDLKQPLDLADASADYPPEAQLLVEAKRDPNVSVVAENAFWYDLPVWLASGRLDAVVVAGDHLLRNGVTDNEAWGKPRDRVFYPPPHGVGRWSETIYYHALNCGLRIPLAAGSGSGTAFNPVGYNRMYVYCGDEFSWENWWKNLRAGKVFITNGPLLRTTVMAEPPGYVFTGGEGETFRFEIALDLATREKIDYLEIVKNGRAEHHVRLEQFREANGRLPIVEFDASGWFLVRAVTNNEKTYRYASTAPYYVEIAGKPRISRASAQFFVDWTLERAKQIKLDNAEQKAEVLRYHRAAHEFWNKKLADANAE